MTGGPPLTTVVVVTWNRLALLKECIESLRSQDVADGEFDVLVVDNASTDGTAEWVAAQTDLRLLRLPTNRGFAGGMAAALEQVRTPYVAMLNNDAVAEPAWLRSLVEPLVADPAVGATTSKILLEGTDRVLQSTGVVVDAGGRGSDRGYLQRDEGQFDGPAFADVFGFCGGAAAVRTSAVRAVGGFWADLFLYYEDVDLSWRLRRGGFRVTYVASAVAVHRHGASSHHGSDRFYFYNLRNRLAVLLANAPLSSLLAQAAHRRGTDEGEVSQEPAPERPAPTTRVRARALGGLFRMIPSVWRRRRSLPSAADRVAP